MEIPVLDIAIRLYELYQKKQAENFFNELTLLMARGYRKGVSLFEIVFDGFRKKYKDQKTGITSNQQIKNTLLGTFGTTKKMETYLGTYEAEGSQINFEFNETLRRDFCESMIKYFRFILGDPVIKQLFVDDKEAIEFKESFINTLNKVDSNSPEEFIKYLFPNAEITDIIKLDLIKGKLQSGWKLR